MIEIKGKNNTAKVMIDSIDETTYAQILQMMNCEAFSDTNVAIMPDCHAGAGAVIGFTMELNDYIIPNIIGVDISCGMLAQRIGTEDIDLVELDNWIKQNIPHGYGVNSSIDSTIPRPLRESVQDVCKLIGIERDYALRSIGSLGGGNHFIEVGTDKEGYHWTTIHSGSRNFGLQIAKYFQSIADNEHRRTDGLSWLNSSSEAGTDYLKCMEVANEFAAKNRSIMLDRIVAYLGQEKTTRIESVHNFIYEGVIRKGACSAELGQPVLIPFNMRDGIAVGIGRGNSEYNCSSPHGAGRIMSRSKAKKNLDVELFQLNMKEAGIYTTTANESTLDEAPDAYKDMQIIIDNIHPTVEIIDRIVPIYNFKA